MNEVFRITISNVSRETVLDSLRSVPDICGATLWHGFGYALEYENGATEKNVTIETVCSRGLARVLCNALFKRCNEDSVYVTRNGCHASLWYRDESPHGETAPFTLTTIGA